MKGQIKIFFSGLNNNLTEFFEYFSTREFVLITNVYDLIFSFISTESMLYQFLVAAVTNYHTLGDLNNRKCILSQFWRSEFQNRYQEAETKRPAGPCSLRRLQGRICSLSLPASGGLQQASVCGCIMSVSACVVTCLLLFCVFNLPLSFIRVHVKAFRIQPDNPK